jgi:hypothetical protein
MGSVDIFSLRVVMDFFVAAESKSGATAAAGTVCVCVLAQVTKSHLRSCPSLWIDVYSGVINSFAGLFCTTSI